MPKQNEFERPIVLVECMFNNERTMLVVRIESFRDASNNLLRKEDLSTLSLRGPLGRVSNR